MILRDRYGPRFRDESGCRSRSRLSRLHVTLPGWRAQVGRSAYGGCCGIFFIFWRYDYTNVKDSSIDTVRQAWWSEHGSAERLRLREDDYRFDPHNPTICAIILPGC